MSLTVGEVAQIFYKTTSNPYWKLMTINTINFNSNEYIQFKNQNTVMTSGSSATRKFTVANTATSKDTTKLECFGNVNSMIGFSNTLYPKCYKYMFNSLNITSAPTLPATELAEGCYDSMFYGCASLTVATELPATTLAKRCYQNMFSHCTSLVKAPELPVTNLAEGCYDSMFHVCTSLSYVKVGFTDWNRNNDSTYSWLYNVSSTGTFVYPKGLPIQYGADYIPENWTIVLDETV